MFQITNLIKKHLLHRLADGGPKISWEKIKEKVLGKKYELSLVLAGNALMKKLNIKYRKQNKAASVLSFPFSKTEAPLRQGSAGQGEIFINLSQKKHSPVFLFIHALLHLKGLEHSAKMEEQEQELMKQYGSRHRHRP
ncbi:MAG: rRNA maturation RNase YbeY [Candidatus Tagabacteria bacterium]